MKAKAMLELAEWCGLTSISEAYSNVSIHAGQLFEYENMRQEMEELFEDCKQHNLFILRGDVHDATYYAPSTTITVKEALEVLK